MKKKIYLILCIFFSAFYGNSQSITATINGPLWANCGSASNFTVSVLGLFNTQSTVNCSGQAITHISTEWTVNGVPKGNGISSFSFNPTSTEISNNYGAFWIGVKCTIQTITLSPPDVAGQPCKQVTTTQVVTPIQWVVHYKAINLYASISCTNPTIIRGCQTPIQLTLNDFGIDISATQANFIWTLPLGWSLQNQTANSVTVIPSTNPSTSSTLGCTYSYAGCNSSKSFSGFNLVNQVLTGSMNGTEGKIICPNTVYTFNVNPVQCGSATYSWAYNGWTNPIYSNGNKTLQVKSPSLLSSSNLWVNCTASFIGVNPPPPILKNFQLFKRATYPSSPTFNVFNTPTTGKKSVSVLFTPEANTIQNLLIYRKMSSANYVLISSTSFLASNNEQFRVFLTPNSDGLDCQGNDISFCGNYQLQNATSYNPGALNITSYCIVPRNASEEALVNENDIFTIYPNPSAGVFNIKSSYPNPSQLKVYNQMGQIVYLSKKVEFNHSIVDLTSQPNGIYYFIHLDNEGIQLNKESVILQK